MYPAFTRSKPFLDLCFIVLNKNLVSKEKKIQLVHSCYFKKIKKKRQKDFHRKGAYSSLAVLWACCRESCRRSLHLRIRPNQIKHSLACIFGHLTEMATGEGKTISLLPFLCYQGIFNEKTFVTTTNDYLSSRDYQFGQEILNQFGISCSFVNAQCSRSIKKNQYQNTIIYTTLKEIAFDFLKQSQQPNLFDSSLTSSTLIIDEADDTLLDASQVPFVLSSKRESNLEYHKIIAVSRFLKNSHLKEIIKTERSRGHSFYRLKDKKMQELFHRLYLHRDSSSLCSNHVTNSFTHYTIEQVLLAFFSLKKDIDYIVDKESIILIDRFTGRPLKGHSYSGILQLALHIKEGLHDGSYSKFIDSVTVVQIVSLFKSVLGTSGTMGNHSPDLWSLYGMKLKKIKNYAPTQRIHLSNLYFKSQQSTLQITLDLLDYLKAKKQPVVINTQDTEKSNDVSKSLEKSNLTYELFTPYQIAQEKGVVKRSGNLSSITISTHLMGRGTDIGLGTENENHLVRMLGGLAAFSFSCPENFRILNQFIGRSGRQGNPGLFRLLSFDDSIIDRSDVSYYSTRSFNYRNLYLSYVIDKAVVSFFSEKSEESLQILVEQKKRKFEVDSFRFLFSKYLLKIKNLRYDHTFISFFLLESFSSELKAFYFHGKYVSTIHRAITFIFNVHLGNKMLKDSTFLIHEILRRALFFDHTDYAEIQAKNKRFTSFLYLLEEGIPKYLSEIEKEKQMVVPYPGLLSPPSTDLSNQKYLYHYFLHHWKLVHRKLMVKSHRTS